jgi:hypothetical protein
LPEFPEYIEHVIRIYQNAVVGQSADLVITMLDARIPQVEETSLSRKGMLDFTMKLSKIMRGISA